MKFDCLPETDIFSLMIEIRNLRNLFPTLLSLAVIAFPLLPGNCCCEDLLVCCCSAQSSTSTSSNCCCSECPCESVDCESCLATQDPGCSCADCCTNCCTCFFGQKSNATHEEQTTSENRNHVHTFAVPATENFPTRQLRRCVSACRVFPKIPHNLRQAQLSVWLN